jgi:hypothetical protein
MSFELVWFNHSIAHTKNNSDQYIRRYEHNRVNYVYKRIQDSSILDALQPRIRRFYFYDTNEIYI